jgi:hypothetical protein
MRDRIQWFSRRPASGFAVVALATLSAATVPAQQSCRVSGRTITVQGLPEASGIAISDRNPGVLWSHNDSGEPVLAALSTEGAVRGWVRLTGAKVNDWEDIDVGPCPQGSCVYVGDIGDNSAKRGSIVIYRAPEPAANDKASAGVESMQLTYPDGPRDAEALAVMPDGSLFIVSKGEGGPISLYKTSGPFRNGASAQLERLATIAVGGGKGATRAQRITGAGASPDGRWVALRSLQGVMLYAASDLKAGTIREIARVDVSGLGEQQGEGVDVANDGTVWLASEGGGKSRPGTIARLECSLK